MYKVIVFAGTTEGYEISRFLAAHQVKTCACVATEYGSRSLEESEYLHVMAKRLTEEEMTDFFKKEKPELVLDATHPYAQEVTKNIKTACENAQYDHLPENDPDVCDSKEPSSAGGSGAKTGTGAVLACNGARRIGVPYIRILRAKSRHQNRAVYVESAEAAVEYLKNTKGNILLTTGSKELVTFTELPDYKERLYARVLSLTSVLEACLDYGIEGKHLIGMQGPFSKEMNVAMLRQYDCAYLVTKDSGKAGGFQEKMEAAEECKATAVIIGRSLKEEGISIGACKKMLAKQFGFSLKQEIAIVGIGMGSRDTLTVAAGKTLEEADLVIGARRMVDAVKLPYQDTCYEYKSEAILDYIEKHPEYEKIAIVLSGDVGFYSGARKLLDADARISDGNVKIICGISSVVYFMSKIGLSWDDAILASAHGRDRNLISLIRHNPKVFSILGTAEGVAKLAKKLTYYDMGDVLLYVGENLSYREEKILAKRAAELADYAGDPLSVVCAYNPSAQPLAATHGIRDSAFLRGKAPMTKEEIRTVSLAKLRLQEDSVCYDVGAGTGSVSIEMAIRAHQGKVYAIEKKADAVQLLSANKQKFAADNLEIIEGTAPLALENLPVPTHAFIGGSSGNMNEILQVLTEKNPNVRIVINCITLETVTETLKAIQKFGFTESEIVQIGTSRAKVIGHYHMMMGENPIYIITCQNVADRKLQ